MTTTDRWQPSPTTAALMDRAATVSRQRLTRRALLAAEHLRRLEMFGLAQQTCYVCKTCPDWINHPPPPGTY